MKHKNLLAISALALTATMLFACNGGGKKPVRKYTVTFFNGEEVYETQKVEVGDYATKPERDPERAGFDFYGWYTENEGGREWNFNVDYIEEDTDLFARFVSTYTITVKVGEEVVGTYTTNSETQESIVLPSEVDLGEGETLLGWGATTGTSRAAADFRPGMKLAYEQITEVVDDNNRLELNAIITSAEVSGLHVGVWGRYSNEEFINRLFDAFWLQSESDYDVLRYTYFSDEEYHGVDNFAAGVLDDDTIGVALPVGSNFKSKADAIEADAVKELTALGNLVMDEKEDQNDRFYGRIGDTDVDKEFTEWLISDEGKLVCDPNYLPPQPSATDFVVAAWGRYTNETDVQRVVAAFKTYLNEETEIEYDSATYVYFNGTDYKQKLKYMSAVAKNRTIDVMYPVAEKMSKGTDTEFPSSLHAYNSTLIEAIKLGEDVLTDRYACTLNEDALSVAFITFIQTEAGKAALNPTA